VPADYFPVLCCRGAPGHHRQRYRLRWCPPRRHVWCGGGGSLGDLAIRFEVISGFKPTLVITVALLVIFVTQLLQMLGDRLVIHLKS